MRVLVIGLGSMGRRRIRCLQTLGVDTIAAFDVRPDRREEAAAQYGIATVAALGPADVSAADAVIISVPPDAHGEYMRQATQARRSYFVEASVIDQDFAGLEQDAAAAGIVAAPSLTMTFHPAIRCIDRLVKSGRLGAISNFMYHFGQYLPDWHTYEKVSDFYVSNPLTGGAREIVPFELTWLVRSFGWPTEVTGTVKKTRRIEGAELIDDTYVLTMQFDTHPGTLLVDVVSRLATRSLTVVGSEAQLLWDWNSKTVRVFDGNTRTWEEHAYEAGAAAAGYNANIGEQMYVDEMRLFLDACRGGARFPNTLSEDARVLRILTAAETSSRERRTACLAN